MEDGEEEGERVEGIERGGGGREEGGESETTVDRK